MSSYLAPVPPDVLAAVNVTYSNIRVMPGWDVTTPDDLLTIALEIGHSGVLVIIIWVQSFVLCLLAGRKRNLHKYSVNLLSQAHRLTPADYLSSCSAQPLAQRHT
jgi:hypothetical protein